MPHFTFQSYSWSLGTTSFRMADFHRKVEEQLVLLNDFWNIPENNGVEWSRESGIQKKYYEYLLKNGFIYGKIDKDEDKEKTARCRDIRCVLRSCRILWDWNASS